MAEEHTIILRAEAKARGLKRYFTAKACKKQHIAERQTRTGLCLECKKAHDALHFRKTYVPHPRSIIPGTKQEKVRAGTRRWKAANREHVRQRDRKYRADNAESARAKERRWREKHGDRARAIKLSIEHNRSAKKRGSSGGTHTAADLAEILKAQNDLCVYCRADLRKSKRHVDHIQPLSAGGSNDRTNLQYLCAPCNLSKGAKDPIAFARELGRLL